MSEVGGSVAAPSAVAHATRDGFPSVSVSLDATGTTVTAVVSDIDAIPKRVPGSAERAAGISSFDPPTVALAIATHDPAASAGAARLGPLAVRAVGSAVASARGALSGAEYLQLALKVRTAVNAALRDLGYSV